VDETDQSDPVRKGLGNHAALKSINCCRAEKCEEVKMKETEALKRASWSRVSY
jgi:hypothetical protein